MRRIFFVLRAVTRGLPLMLLGVVTAWAVEPGAVIKLAVRDQYELTSASSPERVAIGDPAVADVVVLKSMGGRPGSVLLVGKKPGSTTLSLWTKGAREPRTHVVTVLGDMATLLPSAPGTSVDVLGERAVVRGQYAGLQAHEQALITAQDAIGEGTVVDTSTIGVGGVVQVDVKVVEFSKTVLKEIGFNLVRSGNGGFAFGLYNPGRYTGGAAPGSGTVPGAAAAISDAFNLVFTNAARSFSLNLSLLESNGMARVLAEPSLVALSGQSASFLSGGELPVPSAGALGTTSVEYKPFGIGLTLTPTVLSRDRIALKVAPEASDIDWANGVLVNGLQVPAIVTRRADTTVELGDGESFVIGGLVSRTTVSNLDKIPLLGDLPIIGTFFRGMRYSQQEKELVIVVTPRLIQPLARGTALPLPGDAQERRDSPGNAWGSYVMGTAGRDVVPGFSR